MAIYISKPKEYEIIRWSGINKSEMSDFVNPDYRSPIYYKKPFQITNKNGTKIVNVGDYVLYFGINEYHVLTHEYFVEKFISKQDYILENS